MDVDLDVEDLRHDAYLTLLGTAVAYGILLAALTAVVFVVPYLIFRLI